MSGSMAGNKGEAMRPPGKTGDNAITATSTSAVAANLSLATQVGHWVTMQPVGGDAYVRFKSTADTAEVATTTGHKIPDGEVRHYFITTESKHCEHIASATCTLRWWRSSE
jgi:hypothetical protein